MAPATPGELGTPIPRSGFISLGFGSGMSSEHDGWLLGEMVCSPGEQLFSRMPVSRLWPGQPVELEKPHSTDAARRQGRHGGTTSPPTRLPGTDAQARDVACARGLHGHRHEGSERAQSANPEGYPQPSATQHSAHPVVPASFPSCSPWVALGRSRLCAPTSVTGEARRACATQG